MDVNSIDIKSLLGDTGLLSSINYTSGQIIMSLFLAFVLSVFVYQIYQKTYQGVAYSRNFGVSLVLVSMISSVIVMAISGNLALSLGMIGALSIVRFRSAIKDPRDIAYLFWAVSNGILSGVFIYKLAIVSNVMIGITMIYFAKTFVKNSTYLLIVNGWNISKKEMMKLLAKDCSFHKIRYEHVANNKQELHVEISCKEDANFVGDMVMKIQKEISNVENVSAISNDGLLNSN